MVLGSTGFYALTGERFPILPDIYEVPQTQQLPGGENYFENKASQQSTIFQMKQGVPFNWNE